jgi:2,4-dienoyl-CoA reductase-like NADH-dependent reductase (Old Yellow Enzyme family)
MTDLTQPLTLPCGAVLPNRICKSAMTEGLSNPRLQATPRHAKLYETWSASGAGLLITGNVMIDKRVLERPGNVAVDQNLDNGGFEALQAYAAAGTKHGNHLWMQISHAGRQSPWYVAKEPLAPSAVQLELMGNYKRPRALLESEILDFIQRFAFVAKTAQDAGFTGVQIHAAHGYLLSSFLSPITNQRTDAWGGSLENRARFLLEAVRATRKAVGAGFPIGIKLNSDDFRKGGFSHEDCLQVVQWLNAEGIDLLEISGGNYEQPMLLGHTGKEASVKRESTRAREAYFLDYATNIRKVATMPLMVTGGFSQASTMQQALAQGIEVIGLARPFCTHPNFVKGLLDGSQPEVPRPLPAQNSFINGSSNFMLKMTKVLGEMGWYYDHIFRLADGLEPRLHMGNLAAFNRYLLSEYRTAWKMQR